MFEDFDNKASTEGRGRRGVSAVLSLGMFGGLALAIGGAVTAHQVHRARVEREQQVTFADLPQVQAPKPKTLAKPQVGQTGGRQTPAGAGSERDSQRAARTRPRASWRWPRARARSTACSRRRRRRRRPPPPPPPPAPKAEPVAPPPEQERESIESPKFVSGCRSLDLPPALMASAATIRIEVEMMIDENGKVVVGEGRPVAPADPRRDGARVRERAAASSRRTCPTERRSPTRTARRFVLKPAQA